MWQYYIEGSFEDSSTLTIWSTILHDSQTNEPPPQQPMPRALMRVAVGEAQSPHRAMLNHSHYPQSGWDAGHPMSVMGWTHSHAFWALRMQIPGAIRVIVGEALNGGVHRAMVSHGPLPEGWNQYLEFWAFTSKQPGTICMVVGQAENPHRIIIHPQTHWDVQLMTDAGWTKHSEFWVYPTELPETSVADYLWALL